MSTWTPGNVIHNEYKNEKELGRGGMGWVWLVKSNSTGRRFSVKQAMLKEGKFRKAFLAECGDPVRCRARYEYSLILKGIRC